MTLGMVLAILLVIVVFVVIGCWIVGKTLAPPYQGWGYAVIGLIGLICLILLLVNLMGGGAIFNTPMGHGAARVN